MDFGFGRFLEMFHERFGRFPTDVLLLLIAIAVISVCVNLTISRIIVPVFNLAKDWNIAELNKFFQEYFAASLFSLLVVFLLALFLGSVLTRVFGYKAVKKFAEKMVVETEDNINRAHEVLANTESNLKKLRDIHDDKEPAEEDDADQKTNS